MRRALQAARMLALSVWVGGVVFFAFVVAPVAFGRLPTTHEAGLVVGGCLRVLHWMGLVAGVVFCGATLAMGRTRREAILVAGVAVMLGLTAMSQFGILPRMERDRVAAGGVVGAVGETDPGRVTASADFDRLHGWSEKMEGVVLLVGLAVLVGTSAEGVGGRRMGVRDERMETALTGR